jgi:16S rRNA G966 N2-methylase RsmD
MIERIKNLDDDLKEKYLLRVTRYLNRKNLDETKIKNYFSKIEKEIQHELTQKTLLAEIHEKFGSKSYLDEVVREFQQGKYVDFYLKGKEAPFRSLLSYFENYPPAAVLQNSDFRQSAIAENSIDLIITDPPYPKAYLSLYRDLARFAEKVLKPGGSLLAMAGQSYLPDIFKLMQTEGLKYNWTLSYLTPGGQSPQLWDRKVNAFWKPVLWYVKGQPDFWIGDVVKSAVNDNDKNFHFWGQSESGMAHLIQKVSYAGQTILDPFLGGGTTGIVAAKLHRRFIGIEIDREVFQVAQKRFAEAHIPVK